MGEGKKARASTCPIFQQLGGELAELVRRGIPNSLQQRRAVLVDAGEEGGQGMGGAFQGGDAEPSFLDDVSTAVPRVEVRKSHCADASRETLKCNVRVMADYRAAYVSQCSYGV